MSLNAVAEEQAHLDVLYRRLEQMRGRVTALAADSRSATDGTPAGLFNRDALQHRYTQELAGLSAAEHGLCFGRLDTDDGEHIHLGRLGITDGTPDRRQLLIDWRAPAAAPFYTATALNPLGVVRRRHVRTRLRKVRSVSDEYLQASSDGTAEVPDALGVGGDSALLEALNAPRTGRMGDIVETIQAEQDAIIRADRNGVLVVQGGPGTGKTVVALHRAAYLLYTFRERLGPHGVLVVGPSQTFLNYIGQVLPSLGERSVVLATIGTLLPGVSATAVEEPAVAEIKGRQLMAAVIDHAVLDRQRMPRRRRTIGFDRQTLLIDAALLRQAQRRAWGSRLPHNRARSVFVRAVVDGLARQMAARPGARGLDDSIPLDLAGIRRELAAEPAVGDALADLWPPLTPQQLIGELFADPDRLAFAAPSLSPAQRALLQRKDGSDWTVSDVPLLDEAAELLGEVSRADIARDQARRAELEFARDALEAMGSAAEGQADAGIGFTIGMVSAEELAGRHQDESAAGSTADRAAADREWTYGHVVVDEAQELSPMAWRMLVRRCPLKSMTVVGDVAQTGDIAGSTSWAKALNPHVRGRWRMAELTVNYRTPQEIMAVAEPVLAAIDPELAQPTSVRQTGLLPWVVQVNAERVPSAVAELVAEELGRLGAGQLAVLHSGDAGELLDAVRALVPAAVGEAGPGRSVVVLDVRQAKGLEFDAVVVVEPAQIVRSAARGLGDLYVALTRATQRLGIVHSAPLPAVLADAEQRIRRVHVRGNG